MTQPEQAYVLSEADKALLKLFGGELDEFGLGVVAINCGEDNLARLLEAARQEGRTEAPATQDGDVEAVARIIDPYVCATFDRKRRDLVAMGRDPESEKGPWMCVEKSMTKARAILALRPVPPAGDVGAIYRVLRDYRLTNMRDEDGGEYPLVDLVSNEPPADISSGEDELRLLADAIAEALSAVPPAEGSDAAKLLSYEHAHADAVALGYPSLTEALEALSPLPAEPQGPNSKGLPSLTREGVELILNDTLTVETGVEDGTTVHVLRGVAESADAILSLAGEGGGAGDDTAKVRAQ